MFYMLLVLLSIILYVEDWLVTQSFKIGYIPRCFVPLLDFFLYFLSFQIFMCLGLIIFSPECHMCWTRSTNACFMNDSNSSNVSDVTCWIEKKKSCAFYPLLPNGNEVGGPRGARKSRGIYFPRKALSGLPFPGYLALGSQRRPDCAGHII
jgi:hypothetical protein